MQRKGALSQASTDTRHHRQNPARRYSLISRRAFERQPRRYPPHGCLFVFGAGDGGVSLAAPVMTTSCQNGINRVATPECRFRKKVSAPQTNSASRAAPPGAPISLLDAFAAQHGRGLRVKGREADFDPIRDWLRAVRFQINIDLNLRHPRAQILPTCSGTMEFHQDRH